MRHSDTLHSRNKLLVYIIWTMLALGIAVDFLTNATTEAIIVLLEVGGLACAVATVFTFKRWLQNYIMYIISGIISVLTLLLIVTGPLWTTYLLVYVNLAVMTLVRQLASHRIFGSIRGCHDRLSAYESL